MFVSAFCIIIPLICQLAHGTSLCKEREWYDHHADKCHSCSACPGKTWEMAPCGELQDTMCVDLVEIAKSIKNNQESRARWHEMEGSENGFVKKSDDGFMKERIQSQAKFDDGNGSWSQVMMVVLCLSFMTVSVFAVVMAFKCTGRIPDRENAKAVARARLFSRDRLNTTDYMTTLATLDRRLAMDEILEKKKRAVFEPQLLNENIYSDEVFVDISGLPRNVRGNLTFDETDNRRCLLQMQER